MTWYILDSDHFTLHQRRHPVVIQRLAGAPSARVFVSIVTVEEQLRSGCTVRRSSASIWITWAMMTVLPLLRWIIERTHVVPGSTL
jgi:hypothetical protein